VSEGKIILKTCQYLANLYTGKSTMTRFWFGVVNGPGFFAPPCIYSCFHSRQSDSMWALYLPCIDSNSRNVIDTSASYHVA